MSAAQEIDKVRADHAAGLLTEAAAVARIRATGLDLTEAGARDLLYHPQSATQRYEDAFAEFEARQYPDSVRHDYEPGETTHPMHTDPDCRVCGLGRKSIMHR